MISGSLGVGSAVVGAGAAGPVDSTDKGSISSDSVGSAGTDSVGIGSTGSDSTVTSPGSVVDRVQGAVTVVVSVVISRFSNVDRAMTAASRVRSKQAAVRAAT